MLSALALVAASARADDPPLPEPLESRRAVGSDTGADAPLSDFVSVSGTQFILGGQPFHFLGANVAVMHGRPHRDAMERTLDAVRADGLRVIRIWALGERPAGAPAWARQFSFRVGEEGWVEESFEHLDRVLVAARERDLRVIVVLANRWTDYGGLAQYLRWVGAPFDEALYPGPSELDLTQFWDCTRCTELYRSHVERVVGRTNGITGVAYRDDPTIMAWELVNESSAPARASTSLVRWTADQARLVRSMAPRQLVSAGHIGYGRASARATWLAIQRLPEIDYCDAHAYPAASPRVMDERELARYVDDRVGLAHGVAGKPFIWGEFGFSTSRTRVLGRPRARWYDAFLRASHRSGASGALVWTYVPYVDRPREHGIYFDGDGERRTRDIRAVIARNARRWAAAPPQALQRSQDLEHSPPLGRMLYGTGDIHRRWRSSSLYIPAERFWRARFESAGVYSDGELLHLWGEGRGEVEYRFRGPPSAERVPSRLRIGMRASSELPGGGAGATAEDGSRISISIDGVELGQLDLPPDDGLGSWVELVVDDAAVLGPIFHRDATHRLRLGVVPGIGAEGLCLYGVAGQSQRAVGDELPAGIEIEWSPPEPAL